jgi:mono/diheme cytochrome c family protein
MLRSAIVFACLAIGSLPVAADEISVETGARVAVIGGCHDCHTAGYAQSGGKVDPAKALAGDVVGFQGPWGTTYPANLRLTLSAMNEDAFVTFAQHFETRPPMPWFNVHALSEAELRSFYRYVKSLGDPGSPAPAFVPPGGKTVTPYIVFAPPQMPAQ